MAIHTYRAKNLREAIALVRSELGPDASVLHAREHTVGPLRRWFGGCGHVEVAASVDIPAPPRFQTPPPEPAIEPPQTRVPSTTAPPRGASEHDPELLAALDGMGPEFGEDRKLRLLQSISTRGGAAPGERLGGRIRDYLAITGPIQTGQGGATRTIALVGPTGVGKTTTIAKLAAGLRLNQGLSVGLVTLDTYRVAAVEQLRTYAEIMDLPMQVAESWQSLRDAIDALRGMDVVLIDTGGHSPRDRGRLGELAQAMHAAEPDEVHLVLSATSSVGWASTAWQAFQEVRVNRLLWTKLDEATNLAAILALAMDGAPPLSFVTDGQRVPQDIRPADAAELANYMAEACFA